MENFGVIGGFIIGNIILTYVANGNTVPLVYIQEVLIASIGLLLLPKSATITVEDLIGKTKYLPVTKENALEGNSEETIKKLNGMSDTISEIAKGYEEVAATVVDEDELTEKEKNKNIFIDNILTNFEAITENILYEDVTNIENGIIEDIFEILLKKDEIEKQDIIKIFEKHNSFIVSSGAEDNELEQDLFEIVKNINYTYQISKLNFIWKQKVKASKKTMSTQLNGVSKAISSLAEDIKESGNSKKDQEKLKEEIKLLLKQKDIILENINITKNKSKRYIVEITIDNENNCNLAVIQSILEKILKDKLKLSKIEDKKITYISKDKFSLEIGMCRTVKNGSKVSGDSNTQIKLEDGKYLVAISDGMGSGEKAKKSSKIAIKMLENLLSSGFDKDISIQLINSSLSAINMGEDTYATLDVAILDLYQGNVELIKNGACETFVRSGDEVRVIKDISLPAGIMDKIDLVVYDTDLQEGDIIVMCTDGITDSKQDDENNIWLKDLIQKMNTNNVQKMADIIINESIDNGFGIAKDDMTVIVMKIAPVY